MRKKLSQNEFFIVFFSIISIIMLFVPFQKTEVPIYYGIDGYDKGDFGIDTFNLPWRSYNQELELNLTIISGKLRLLILDNTNAINFFTQKPINPYLQVENITKDLYIKIFLNPPMQGSINILFIAEEFTWLKRDIILRYTFFHSNYGFFFLGIVFIFSSYYIYKKYKLRH